MTISKHDEKWLEHPIQNYEPGEKPLKASKVFYRLSLSYDQSDSGENFVDLLDRFLQEPAAAKAEGLIVGPWEYEDMVSSTSQPIVEALVAARDRLPKLKALFIGDITFEECEVSWINQSDFAPLFGAYPNLAHLRVRGSNNLSFGRIQHANLESLIVESGGLPAPLIAEVAKADLPKLEHLELWLGTDNYGGINDTAPLQPLLTTDGLPKLRYLGLRNSQIADAVAQAVAQSPILQRMEVLDLSLGTLGDAGAEALLNTPAIRKLKSLDIHHHWVSKKMVEQLAALVTLDAGDPQEGDSEDRYCALSE